MRLAVASAAGKDIAGVEANTVAGVFAVTNQLGADKAR